MIPEILSLRRPWDLRSHAVFKRAGGSGVAKVITHIGDAVGTGVVEILPSAFGFNDERSSGPLHDLAVASRIADLDEQFGVALHVDFAGWEIDELHRAFLPSAFHHAEREAGADDEVLDVGGIDTESYFQKTAFPAFPFPAMRWGGVDREAFVAIADRDEHVEVVGAHGGGGGVDFMGEIDAEFVRVGANLGGLLDEALLAFLEEIVARPGPETPRITGGHFPAERHAPEGG